MSAQSRPANASAVVSDVRNWPDLLVALMSRQDLDAGTAAWAMDEIMSGNVPDVTMAAFLVAHHGKGETVLEYTNRKHNMGTSREEGKTNKMADLRWHDNK